MRNNNWVSYGDARKFVHTLKLKSRSEWAMYCKSGNKPDTIPFKVDRIYKTKGWVSWGDFLGTGIVASQKIQFRSFDDAREFVHTLKLKKNDDWKIYSKSEEKPLDIPANPRQTYYTKGWKSIPDWLGTGIGPKDRIIVSYDECSIFAQGNNITSQNEWADFSKSGTRPNTIPAKPDREYKKQGLWTGWPAFLGTNRVANQNKKFLPFDKARTIVHKLKFETQQEFRIAGKEGKLPKGITGAPWQIHKNEFTTWGDWLGTDRISNQKKSQNFLSWPQAKIEYRKLSNKFGLTGYTDWIQFSKNNSKLLKDLNLPTDPRHVYSKEKVWAKMKLGDNVDN
jgi:hypothetical protein